MKTNRCIWLAATLLALAAGSCTKDDSSGGDPAGTKSYNKTIDAYLSERYLWNEEYQQMQRDLKQEYVSDDQNLLVSTLMRMSVNDLDKKLYTGNNGSYYALYSNIVRTSKSRAEIGAPTRGVNHPSIQKKQEFSFGFARIGIVSFQGSSNVGFYVMAVYPGSPAALAGFKRGTIFTKVNGATVPNSKSAYTAIYKQLTEPSGAATISLTENTAGAQAKQLSAVQLLPDPVIHKEIINRGDNKIGYLVYTGFDAAYDDELLEAVAYLREKAITDLVLDLRYNGGGHVISSKMLSTCIAGAACEGKVFQYYRYNDTRMASTSKTQQQTGHPYDASKNRFREDFSYGDYYGVDLKQYALGMRRLYVLTTANTASSSEALINSLRGIGMSVTLIGETTNGKNVGMEVKTFDDGSDTYTLSPITFQGYNAEGTTVNPTGMTVNFQVDEWRNGLTDFGASEPLVAKALEQITGQAAAPAAVKSAGYNLMPSDIVAQPDDSRRPSGMLVLASDGQEQ